MKLKAFILLLVILVGAAAFTNPNEQAHKDKLAEAINTELQANAQSLGTVGKALGSLLSGSISKLLADPALEYHSNILYSTGTLQDKTVTIGLFGQVFTTDEIKNIGQ